MFFSHKRLGAVGLALLVGVWACGTDGTGPNDGNFDAQTTADGLESVDATFQTAAFASLDALGDDFGLPGSAALATTSLLQVAAHPDAPDFSLRAAEAAQKVLATSAPAAVLIPEQYRGLTLVYHTGEGHYIVDEEREGAPENGVRFILYAVNPVTHEITEPLTEIGYADITDEGTETTAVLRLTVVSNEVTYLDYTITLSGLLVSPVFTLSGYITDGTERADFTLVHALTLTLAGWSVEIDYDIDVGDFSMDVSIEFEGEGDNPSTTTVNIEFSDGTNTVTVVGAVENHVGSFEVHANGNLFATIAISNTGIVIVGSDGEALSQEEMETLEEILDIMDEIEDVWDGFFDPVEGFFNSQD